MEQIPFDVPTMATTQHEQPPFGLRPDQWLAAHRDLALKKSKAREMVRRIAKNGVNDEQGYSFVEAADVYDLMRPVLADCMLGFEVEYVSKRLERMPSGAPITDVDLRIKFTDLETGYFETKLLNATGSDHSDKGVYKAYTGGEKYALIMEFMIPTGGDAEAAGATKRRSEEDGAEEQKGVPEHPSEPPITSEQVGQIKLKVLQLSKVPGESVEARTKRKIGTYLSLARRLNIKDLDDDLLTTLTEGQAELALQNLDEWIEKRKQLDERKAAGK